MRPSRIGLTLAGTLLTLVLATASGCDHAGSDAAKGASTTTQTSGSPPAGGNDVSQQARKLAECMRANGVRDFPDPVASRKLVSPLSAVGAPLRDL